MKKLMYLMIGAVLILSSIPIIANAHPYHTEEKVSLIERHIDLSPGETRTMRLPKGWRHVGKIYFSANAFYGDASLKVFANGEEKARVFIPREDPFYVANVDETTCEIVLQNYQGRGTIRINSLKADLSTDCYDPIVHHPIPPEITFPALNEAAALARESVTLVDRLRPYADPETEYIRFLLPIKRVGGRALALANARGVGSIHVRKALEALAQQIQFADAYIDASLKKEASFELAVDLLSLKDKIKDWLD